MSVPSGGELAIELKTHGCELTATEYGRIEDSLGALREAVASFPIQGLLITIHHHPRHNDYHVKMSLKLPGQTLFTGERHQVMYTAIEQSVDKLLRKVKTFKSRMQAEAEQSKQSEGTHHRLESTLAFHTKELEEACFYQDYLRFRRGLDGFQPGLNERVGRWVQRYPEIERQLEGRITLSDIVEDVFLHAFEKFAERNPEVPPGIWLESLIDPTIQDLLHFPEAEFANICYAQHRLKEGAVS
jgi:ribosome-associated translation inhibitor RaiA